MRQYPRGRSRSQEAGFTLIELSVAMVLLGMPVISRFAKRGRSFGAAPAWRFPHVRILFTGRRRPAELGGAADPAREVQSTQAAA